MEPHITNLEISKKLKELGIFNNTINWWVAEEGSPDWFLDGREWMIDEYESRYGDANTQQEIIDWGRNHFYPAYLSTELLEILPERISAYTFREVYDLDHRDMSDMKFEIHRSFESPNDFTVIYITTGTRPISSKIPFGYVSKVICDASLSNALGKMLIYLIENEIWKPQ